MSGAHPGSTDTPVSPMMGMTGRERVRAVMMEDEKVSLSASKRALRGLGVAVYVASNLDRAVRYALESQIDFFVLDIDMGKERANEGLDTLERLKDVDPRIFVALYTSKRDALRQQRADRLNVDLIVTKGIDKIGPMKLCLSAYCRQRLQVYGEILAGLDAGTPPPIAPVPREARHRTRDTAEVFSRIGLDADWMRRNAGRFVAWADGAVIGTFDSESAALAALRSLAPESHKFLYEVELDQEVVDLPGVFDSP